MGAVVAAPPRPAHARPPIHHSVDDPPIADTTVHRDAAEVFPSAARAAAASLAGAAQAALGSMQFVTEAQLDELRAGHGERPEDGTADPAKPLAVALAEARDARQEKFDDRWRTMKTGACGWGWGVEGGG